MDVRVRSSGTVGNFGPGFDAMSLSLGPIGDEVRLREATTDEIIVQGSEWAPDAQSTIPTSWKENAVGAVIDFLRGHTGHSQPVRVELTKGVPPGSGLGSSASSCAASALAFAKAVGGVPREILLRAAAEGEGRVSGTHRDDAAAALFGGLAIVDSDRWEARSIAPPPALRLAVVRPHVILPTRTMRAVLPHSVARSAAVRNLSATAQLVAAFATGDIKGVGHAMCDEIATPFRAPRVPGFEAAEEAARWEGALGFALAGSGPSMFAIASDESSAKAIASAMGEAVRQAGTEATAFVGIPQGVRDLTGFVR
ncbi:MAG: homoserine kinase [Thermoplasmatota archaeon]